MDSYFKCKYTPVLAYSNTKKQCNITILHCFNCIVFVFFSEHQLPPP
nr:MAG TPA: hypothetical protein [Caudoviricetes sp.]